MCMPTITILDDRHGKRQTRGSLPPLSSESRGSPPETPPTGVVTARPSTPIRCPVPAGHRHLIKVYVSESRKEKQQVKEVIICKADIPKGDQGVIKEKIERGVILSDERKQPDRNRRCSSISSTRSDRPSRLAKWVEERMLKQKIEDQARRQLEAKIAKRELEAMEEMQQRNHRRRDSSIRYCQHTSRHRDKTPLGEFRGCVRNDTRRY